MVVSVGFGCGGFFVLFVPRKEGLADTFVYFFWELGLAPPQAPCNFAFFLLRGEKEALGWSWGLNPLSPPNSGRAPGGHCRLITQREDRCVVRNGYFYPSPYFYSFGVMRIESLYYNWTATQLPCGRTLMVEMFSRQQSWSGDRSRLLHLLPLLLVLSPGHHFIPAPVCSAPSQHLLALQSTSLTLESTQHFKGFS